MLSLGASVLCLFLSLPPLKWKWKPQRAPTNVELSRHFVQTRRGHNKNWRKNILLFFFFPYKCFLTFTSAKRKINGTSAQGHTAPWKRGGKQSFRVSCLVAKTLVPLHLDGRRVGENSERGHFRKINVVILYAAKDTQGQLICNL